MVRRAVRHFVLTDTGRFSYRVTFEGDGEVLTPVVGSGSYELSSRSATVDTTTTLASGRQVSMSLIVMRDVSFAHLDLPEWGTCWLRYTREQGLAAQGFPTGAGLQQFPPGITAVTYARGIEFSAEGQDTIVGTTDLSLATGLVLPKAKDVLLELVQTNETVRAEFVVVRGRLVAWRLNGDDVSEALEASEVTVDPAVVEAARFLSVDVLFRNLGDPVSISAPPRSDQVPLKAMDSGEPPCAHDGRSS